MNYCIFVLLDEDLKEYSKPLLFDNYNLAVRHLALLIKQNGLDNIAKKLKMKLIGVYNSSLGSIYNFIDESSILGLSKDDFYNSLIEFTNIFKDLTFSGEDIDFTTLSLKSVKEVENGK